MKNNKIITYTILIVFFIFFNRSESRAYFSTGDYYFLHDTFNGLDDASTAILSDTFIPLTHYKASDISLSVSPTYYEIDTLIDDVDSYIGGDDLKGRAMGFSVSYALTDRIMVFANYISIVMKGSLVGDHKADPDISDYDHYPYTWGNNYKMEGELSNHFLQFGFAFDIANGRRWSIPLYFGFSRQYYNLNLEFAPLPGNQRDPYMDLESSGFLDNYSYGIAVSWRPVQSLFITPFLILNDDDENDRNIKFKITDNAVSEPGNEIGNRYQLAFMSRSVELFGIKMAYKFAETPLQFSINITGFLSNFSNWYNEFMYEFGLKMNTISVSITYATN